MKGCLKDFCSEISEDARRVSRPSGGTGYRGSEIETNLHAQVIVIASRWSGTMRYFRALRRELEACSGEEQILILRQEPVIV